MGSTSSRVQDFPCSYAKVGSDCQTAFSDVIIDEYLKQKLLYSLLGLLGVAITLYQWLKIHCEGGSKVQKRMVVVALLGFAVLILRGIDPFAHGAVLPYPVVSLLQWIYIFCVVSSLAIALRRWSTTVILAVRELEAVNVIEEGGNVVGGSGRLSPSGSVVAANNQRSSAANGGQALVEGLQIVSARARKIRRGSWTTFAVSLSSMTLLFMASIMAPRHHPSLLLRFGCMMFFAGSLVSFMTLSVILFRHVRQHEALEIMVEQSSRYPTDDVPSAAAVLRKIQQKKQSEGPDVPLVSPVVDAVDKHSGRWRLWVSPLQSYSRLSWVARSLLLYMTLELLLVLTTVSIAVLMAVGKPRIGVDAWVYYAKCSVSNGTAKSDTWDTRCLSSSRTTLPVMLTDFILFMVLLASVIIFWRPNKGRSASNMGAGGEEGTRDSAAEQDFGVSHRRQLAQDAAGTSSLTSSEEEGIVNSAVVGHYKSPMIAGSEPVREHSGDERM